MVTHEEIDAIACRAADKAISHLFMTLGVDINEPISVQQDFAHLRRSRIRSEMMGNRTIISLIGTTIAAISAAIYAFATHSWAK